MKLDLRVVLVRPRNPLNIGAAARAMANFGFSDMVVVKPYPPVWRETVSAVGAERLVLAARAAKSLEEAAGDRSLILGTTTVRDRRLHQPVVRLPDLPTLLRRRAKGTLRAALLFGSEKTGLPNRYLERCHYIVTVPTDPACPSMNLSHAVAACCYELSRKDKRLGPALAASTPPPAGSRDVELLVRHVLRVFEATGYLKFLPEAERAQKVRRLLLHWNLLRTDLALMHGTLRFILKRMGKAGEAL